MPNEVMISEADMQLLQDLSKLAVKLWHQYERGAFLMDQDDVKELERLVKLIKP